MQGMNILFVIAINFNWIAIGLVTGLRFSIISIRSIIYFAILNHWYQKNRKPIYLISISKDVLIEYRYWKMSLIYNRFIILTNFNLIWFFNTTNIRSTIFRQGSIWNYSISNDMNYIRFFDINAFRISPIFRHERYECNIRCIDCSLI